MKYIHLFISILFLFACEHDPLLSDEAVAVRLIPSLDNSASGDTRVVDKNWFTTDIVGVSIDGTNYKQYKPSANGTSVVLEPNGISETLYYPTNGDPVTFTAFCPHQAPVSNVVTYSAFADQSTSAKMQAVDLVYHKGATGSKSNPTPSIEFQHKFSKIVIIATCGADVADLSDLAMTITNVPTKATFDLNDETKAVDTKGIITPYHDNVAADKTTAMAIVPPHLGTPYTGRTITFKSSKSGLDYSYAIPDGFEFETGKSYEFIFTLTEAEPVATLMDPANCYIINEDASHIIIPLEQAIKGWELVGTTVTTDKTDYVGHLNALLASGDWEVVTLWRTWDNTVAPTITATQYSELNDGKYYARLLRLNVVPKGNNCVIALRSTAENNGYPAKTIWWSWHLWFTDYVPGANMASTKNGQVHTYLSNAFTTGIYQNSVMMDRNLGATGSVSGNSAITPTLSWTDADAGKWYGLMYQWGKKDPFTSTEGQGDNKTEATVCPPIYDAMGVRIIGYEYWNTSSNYWGTHCDDHGVIQAEVKADAGWNDDGFPKVERKNDQERMVQTIRCPYIYFFGGTPMTNWTATMYGDLWLDGNSKTAFDPCPPGWRVPKGGKNSSTDNPWAGFYDGSSSSLNTGTADSPVFNWHTMHGRLYTGIDKNGTVPLGVTAWYPATGVRADSPSVGHAFTLIKVDGYLWAASVHLFYGTCLAFHEGMVNPASTRVISEGLPVRCIRVE